MRLKQRMGIVANADVRAKSLGNGIGGDVIMRGADPARCEHMIMPCPKRVDGGDDGGFVIRHDAHFAQRHPVLGQFPCQMKHVRVARPAR